MDGARSRPLRGEPGSERSGSIVRSGVAAELGHDPAEDPAIGAASAGMLGAAQGGEVGVGGLAEGDITGGGAMRRTVPIAGRYQR